MRPRQYSDEELIQALQDKAKELGRTPRLLDIVNGSGGPSPITYRQRFGSWNNALSAAGLELNTVQRHLSSSFSKEELIQIIQEVYAEIERIPTVKDLIAHPKKPTYHQFRARFGTLGEAIVAAGLPVRIVGGRIIDSRRGGRRIIRKAKVEYSREQLIELLREKYDAMGEPPLRIDVQLDCSMPDPRCYLKEFGTWNQALSTAGIPLPKRRFNNNKRL